MFEPIQPGSAPLRKQRAVGFSVAAHLGLLAFVVLYRPAPVALIPLSLANGEGTRSYHVIYAPPDGEDAPEDAKLVLSHRLAAKRPRPKPSSQKPAPDHLQVPADAEASDHNLRAGSALGTVIDGPVEGHEVRVAYPVIFPDPPVSRSELPPDLKGDVIVEVTIDAEGNVVETRVVQAIGHGIDEKIVTALRLWHYQPATLDGMPVASKHDVHFHFPS